jgi:CRISPR-associated protein Cas1
VIRVTRDYAQRSIADPAPTRPGRPALHITRHCSLGGILSPLLCNLYLHSFDISLLRHGLHGIRYGDDILIPAPNHKAAEEALEVTKRLLFDVELEVAPEKTAIMSFEEGFAFLGEDIATSFPPPDPLEPFREPSRKALYVARDGAAIRIEKGQLHVFHDDEDLLVVPSSQVGSICLFGNVGLSAGARQFALAAGVDVSFASRRGWFQGWLQAPNMNSIELRRLQFRRSDDQAFAAGLAGRFVVGKIANLAALLRRYGNADSATDVVRVGHDLESFAETASSCSDVASLVGVEGAATAAYFRVFGRLMPPGFVFEKRSRQPPTDPVNAALSYGYTLLTGAAVTAVAMAGLDPSAGFLHLDSRDRPSLALDLVEEYRPMVVDTTVLRLCRKGTLTEHHFRTEATSAAVLLTDAGRRALTGAIEQRLLTLTSHIPSRSRVSYRRSMFLQARQIATCIREPAVIYQPMAWR